MSTVGMILCGEFGIRFKSVVGIIPKHLVKINYYYSSLCKTIFDFENDYVNEVNLIAILIREKNEECYHDEYNREKSHYIIEYEFLNTLKDYVVHSKVSTEKLDYMNFNALDYNTCVVDY